MTLTETIARDPPRTRRFRQVAPLLVLLCLAALAVLPGLLVQIGAGEQETVEQLIPYQGR